MTQRRSGLLFVVLAGIVLIVLALALATGGGGGVPQVDQLEPIIPDTTKVMDAETAAALLSVSPDLADLAFSQTTTYLEDLEPGNILVSAPTAAAPDGLLRRVISVSRMGGEILVETEPATLEEAVQQGTIQVSADLTPADLEVASLADGVTMRRAAPQRADSGFHHEIEDVVLYDDDGDLDTTDDQVIANGSISIEPSIDFTLVIREFEVTQIAFTATVAESAEIEISSQLVEGALDAEIELVRYRFRPFLVPGFAIPVVVRPVLTLNVGAEGEISVGLSTGASLEASLSAGLAYEQGNWEPIEDYSFDFEFTPPTLSAEAGIRGYVAPELELQVYGIAAPTLQVTGYLELQGEVSPSVCWELSAGVEVEAGIEVRVLSRVLVDKSFTVIDYHKTLATFGDCGAEEGTTEVEEVAESGGDTSTMLVIDVSGSMGELWQGGVKLESARSAAHQILNMLEQESQLGRARHSVGLAPFTTDAWLEVPVSEDFGTLRAAVDGLSALDATNIGAGLGVANDALETVDAAEGRIVLLLSDGMTNEGLGPQEVLAGPVQEAAAAGICIYTIGFGDPGALDEPLLRQIAQQSGCGEYFYATNVSELEGVYIRIRHVSTGNVLAEFSGTVAPGETVEAGGFEVEAGQGELVISLHWPGSLLELGLIDPRGRMVDDSYQGASVQVYQNLVHAVIEQPVAGRWEVMVHGRDVPPAGEPFSVLVSGRAGAARPPSSGGVWVVFVVLAVGGGAVAVYAAMLRRGARQVRRIGVAPSGATASLTVESGPAAGQRWAVSSAGAEIGRGSSCAIRLRARAVSRLHARLRHAEGAWFVQDQGSAGGTYVNGERVPAARLKSGDRITIGGTTLLFQEQ